jgi:hypothetical protein
MGMISLLFPLRTIIPVRENSEVVMIYPDECTYYIIIYLQNQIIRNKHDIYGRLI